MFSKYCYLNKKIISLNKACVSLNNMGLLRGYGVFDFIEIYNGKPFLLKEHLSRFKQSAKSLNLKIPLSEKQLEIEIKKLILKNRLKQGSIRIVLNGGKTNDGINYTDKQTFFILSAKLHRLPASVYSKGAKLITYQHQREIPKTKATNYITAIKLQKLCRRNKAIEILYTWNEFVLECTTSNFFIFKGDKLITPKDNILHGITRNFVINLAKNKFKVEQRNILLKELKSANEAFITATNKEIVPIVKIDNIKINQGKIGQNTKYLVNLFHKHTKNY